VVGLELTDEIRVTIAGTACLMLLGRDHDLFVRVVSILVYPSGFIERAPAFRRYTAREPVQDETPVFGLSMTRGPIILSWDEVLSGSRDPTDGRNLVFHEFAHKIDETNGVADGTPLFDDNAERIRWGRAFNDAFLADKQRARRDMTGFLGDYALKNEAEYFAVATEMFFERPREMQQALPGVYAVMRDFYRIDFAVNFAVRALEN
jgi:Mlc titration factor MtfA (ptsG expression regulator)